MKQTMLIAEGSGYWINKKSKNVAVINNMQNINALNKEPIQHMAMVATI